MTTEDREKALDKVRKLLRLATSSNANEAALAAAKAQEVMDRYEIKAAMLSLDENTPDPIDSESIENFGARGDWLDTNTPRSFRVNWAGRLATIVTKANGCYSYTQTIYRKDGKTAKAVSICGRGSDVETCRVMYAWISKEVESLVKKQRGASYQWKASYAAGVIDGIAAQIKLSKARMVEQMKMDQSSQTALVHLDRAIAKVESRSVTAKSWAYDRVPGLHQKRSSFGSREPSARELGRADGLAIDLGGAKKRIGPGQKQLT